MTESPLQILKAFLVRAKRATYAGNGIQQEDASRPQSKNLRYEEAEHGLRYLDSYFGQEQFAGEEAVWKDQTPLWIMNYCGRSIAEGFDAAFLKAALSQVAEDAPYRGPIEYQEGSLLYVNNFAGDMRWFFGREEIYKSGVSVYECVYHGGAVW